MPVNNMISMVGNQDDFHILLILLGITVGLLYRDELTTERVDQGTHSGVGTVRSEHRYG
jgi:hypothetical protein